MLHDLAPAGQRPRRGCDLDAVGVEGLQPLHPAHGPVGLRGRLRAGRLCAARSSDLADHEASTGGLTLLLTRGNQASLEMQGQMSDDEFARFEADLRALPGTRLLFANRDARIYHLAPDDRAHHGSEP